MEDKSLPLFDVYQQPAASGKDPSPITLRPYQLQARTSIIDLLSNVSKSTLLVCATGLGKTVIFCAVAQEWHQRGWGKALIIAHREELIQQSADKYAEITGDRPEIEMASQYAKDFGKYASSGAIVSSVQTMCRASRNARFNKHEFGLIIIDEAHHAISASYRTVIDRFRHDGLRVLGVTATPNRADDLALGQVFETVAEPRMDISAGIKEGWLVPITQRFVRVDDLDFSSVKTTAGDLNQGDLDQILSSETLVHEIAKPTVDICGDRQTLIFCVSVSQAEKLAEIINRYRPDSAGFLSGAHPKNHRRQVVRQYKKKKLQYLCNCALFLEGFDAPQTSAVVMARPTKSIVLYTQVVGRGTRPPSIVNELHEAEHRRQAIAQSEKQDVLVLDFVGNSGRHKLISCGDILGGKYSEPIRKRANELIEEKSGMDVEESLSEADRIIQEEERLARELAEKKRLEHIKAREARYESREVSAFDHSDKPAARTQRKGFKIWFGKYEGRHTSEIPSSYLEWIQGGEFPKWLRDACTAEIAARKGISPTAPAKKSQPASNRPPAKKSIEEINRELLF